MQGLVDTGAQKSLIHQSVVASWGVQHQIMKSQEFKIRAIGEKGEISAMGLINLSVSVDTMVFEPVNFLIVPESVLMHNKVILGMDFLSTNKLTVNAPRRLITRSMDDGTKYDFYLSERGEYQKKMLRSVLCVAAEPVTVLPMETKQVSLKSKCSSINQGTSETPDVLYCEEKSTGGKRFTVTPGIVDVEDMTVLVTENNGKKVSIKEGDVIGVLSTMEVVDGGDADDLWTIDRVKEEIPLAYLTEEQRQRAWEVIRGSSGCIGKDAGDVGVAAVTAHTIRLHDDTPIYQRPRRFPEPITEEIERQCQELHSMDVIEPSTSAWASPVVPVRKGDGSIRLCIDYRKLNRVTKADRSPIPNLTDAVYGLHGNVYFTSLDLVKGFYHVPISEDSKEYTAFVTSRSHWQFKRLSFGLRNAPVAFQREIQTILQDFPWKKVIVYIDDILIMEDTFEAHLLLVQKVLSTLSKNNVKINAGKCQWFTDSVSFLGHTVSWHGLRKQQSYVDKVTNFPRPETVSELREFLGLVNFQRKFVRNASTIQKPLSELTGGRKKAKIVWTPERQAAFDSLKERMKEDVLLSFPSYAEDAELMQLWVDASSTGAGACLKQCQHGEEKIIAYASMTFSLTQRNYSTIDRELVALRWGVKTFRSFLYGIQFILKTDHQPLVYLHNMKLVDARLARTLEDLSDFNFVIEYAPGKSNLAADALSRLKGKPEEVVEVADASIPDGFELDGGATPGGGDSLFISLRRVLVTAGIVDVPTSQALRESLVEELLKHPDRYGFTGCTRMWRRDFRLMKMKHQLPCLEVLLAASFIYRVSIYVYFWSKDPIIYRDARVCKETSIAVTLQCLGAIHFNPLIPLADSVVERKDDIKCVTVPVQPEGLSVNSGSIKEFKICMYCVASSHPRVVVSYGSCDFCAIVDSGSEVSLIRRSIFELCLEQDRELELSKEEIVQIEGFTGVSRLTEGTVTLALDLPNLVDPVPHTYAVVPDEVIPNCCLLGMDFILENKLSINCAAGGCLQNETFNSTVKLLPAVEEGMQVHTASVEETSADRDDGGGAEGETITNLLDLGAAKAVQASSPYLSELLELLVAGISRDEWPSHIKQYSYHAHKLRVKDGILMYIDHLITAVVVSLDLLVDVAIAAHYRMLHIGRDKLVHLIKRHVWHPKLYSVCQDICTSCKHCQLMKVARQCYVPPTVKIVTNAPFELLAVDLVTFPKSKDGWIGCCVAIDHNSKWLCAIPIRNKTTTTVCNILEHSIFSCLPRLPERLLSDNGKEFASKEFGEMLSRFSIKHVMTTPYKPSSNGCVERVNRTLGELLRSAESSQGDWRENLTRAIITYNNTRHRELNMSPAEYLMSKTHTVRDVVLISEADTAFWRSGHPKFVSFASGQYVLRKVPRQGHVASLKFKPKYEGPFKVAVVNDNGVTYELENEEGAVIKAHHTQLIPWTAPPDYLRDRLRLFEERNEKEEIAEQQSMSMEEPDFEGFQDLSTTSSSARESPNTVSDSDSTATFGQLQKSLEASHLVTAQSCQEGCELDSSICFGDAVESADSSVIFGGGMSVVAAEDMYKLCSVEDQDSEDDGLSVSDYEPSKDIAPEEATGIVLTPAEEIWEVSSINASTDEEDLLGNNTTDKPEGVMRTIGSLVGTLDSVIEGASAAFGQVISYVSSPSSGFGGFDGDDFSRVNVHRTEVLQRLATEEDQSEAHGTQEGWSLKVCSCGSEKSEVRISQMSTSVETRKCSCGSEGSISLEL